MSKKRSHQEMVSAASACDSIEIGRVEFILNATDNHNQSTVHCFSAKDLHSRLPMSDTVYYIHELGMFFDLKSIHILRQTQESKNQTFLVTKTSESISLGNNEVRQLYTLQIPDSNFLAQTRNFRQFNPTNSTNQNIDDENMNDDDDDMIGGSSESENFWLRVVESDECRFGNGQPYSQAQFEQFRKSKAYDLCKILNIELDIDTFVLPTNLKAFYTEKFNAPLKLPDSVVELYFGSKFNQSFEMPPNIKTFFVSPDFNSSIIISAKHPDAALRFKVAKLER